VCRLPRVQLSIRAFGTISTGGFAPWVLLAICPYYQGVPESVFLSIRKKCSNPGFELGTCPTSWEHFPTGLSALLFGSKLLSRGEGVLEHRLGPSRSIDRAPDSASDVFSGGPDAGDLVLLVHLSLNHVATEIQASKCEDRQSAFAHVRRDATAGPSGHWLRVTPEVTPPTHTREGLSQGTHDRPSLDSF
jgi:hypothetical protein